MSLAILGLGTVQPPHSIAQRDAAEAAKSYLCLTEEQARLLTVLYRRTGVRRRSTVLLEASTEGGVQQQSFFPKARDANDFGPTTRPRMEKYAQEAPPLALAAARRALEESGLTPPQIRALVTASCTGFFAPGIDFSLIRQLGLASTTSRTHVGFMGCHGALNALRVAAAFVESDPAARVLLCAVEVCSIHYHYRWDPDQVVANALFADGAAALVAGPAAHAPPGAWRLAATGSCFFPDSEDAMSWRVGDHGFNMTLSARVPGLIASYLKPWLTEWLAQRELSVAQVQSWAIHPGGPRVVDAVGESLGLSKEATAVSDEVLGECGNMSSPTVLFLIDRLRRRNAPRPCVAMAFGPGLVVEAALWM